MSASPAIAETLEVGDISITFVPDGRALVGGGALFPSSTEALWAVHPELFADDGRLLLTFGAFLVRTAGRILLVDLGMGPIDAEFPAADGHFLAGDLVDNLRIQGVAPAEVDTVFYSHLHLDHVGWTAPGGTLTFPGARHVVGEREFEFWRDLDPAAPLAGVGPGQGVIDPLLDRIESVADGASLAPGVDVVSTPGHTPGHCSLVISSGQERAVLLGDVVHCAIQLTDNDQAMAFDADPELAARTRDRIASELEREPGTTAIPCHFPESVFGRVLRVGDRRTWRSSRAT
ncbi:MBL fold metallo-hydrolase [Actinomycetospora sp. OC33-EN08]|uniref:MBL fold metallo-hydrolase n=1 Tax=Actinomycetospora aurantiaca TaxID=3129233 RepID=A0ABU8MSZ7_9PSEU